VLLVAGIAAGGSTPAGDASPSKIASYYAQHRHEQTASGILLSLGALAFLVFASGVATRLRSDADPGGRTLSLLGAAVLAVGLAALAGVAVTMGERAGEIDTATLRALHLFNGDAPFVFLVTVGSGAFLLGVGVATLATGRLPRWLGWLAVAFAVVAAIPSHVLGGTLDHIGLVAFLGLLVWSTVTGVLLARRS
jgi:hypothetical protein